MEETYNMTDRGVRTEISDTTIIPDPVAVPAPEPSPYLPEMIPRNVKIHRDILNEIHNLYIRKNHDYGDSFHILYEEEGMAAVRIRLGDKLNRFKTLTKGAEQLVADEGVRDTLIDLANCAIMGIIEMDRVAQEEQALDNLTK